MWAQIGHKQSLLKSAKSDPPKVPPLELADSEAGEQFGRLIAGHDPVAGFGCLLLLQGDSPEMAPRITTTGTAAWTAGAPQCPLKMQRRPLIVQIRLRNGQMT